MIRLRPVEARDLEQLRQWRNDPAISLYFRNAWPIFEHQQIRWFEQISDPSARELMMAIEADNRLVGCCGLCYIDWVHRMAEVSLYIGDKEAPAEAGPKAAEAILDLGFKRLGLHKLYCEVFDLDDWRIRYFKMLGMKEVGRFINHRWVNGQWVDSIMLEMLNE